MNEQPNPRFAYAFISFIALIIYAIAVLLILSSCTSDRRDWDPGYGGVKPPERVLGERTDKP